MVARIHMPVFFSFLVAAHIYILQKSGFDHLYILRKSHQTSNEKRSLETIALTKHTQENFYSKIIKTCKLVTSPSILPYHIREKENETARTLKVKLTHFSQRSAEDLQSFQELLESWSENKTKAAIYFLVSSVKRRTVNLLNVLDQLERHFLVNYRYE